MENIVNFIVTHNNMIAVFSFTALALVFLIVIFPSEWPR
jgi:hypothetical protein